MKRRRYKMDILLEFCGVLFIVGVLTGSAWAFMDIVSKINDIHRWIKESVNEQEEEKK